MGVLRSTQSFEAEVEEFKQMMRCGSHSSSCIQGKGSNGISISATSDDSERRRGFRRDGKGEGATATATATEMTVCVTSGISFLGFAVANRLLSRGYTVRLLLDTQEDLEKVREMGMLYDGGDDDDDDMGISSNNTSSTNREWASGASATAVVADMMDVDSLCEAFAGCSCVFHTSAFTDPTGVSGYSKNMAEIEARTATRVIEACVRTQSVRKCVFTSSLLACIWRQNSPQNSRLPTIVDENWWSDESLCRDRKLWFALGKTMAEKAAWRAARGRDLKLVTLCPGLVSGPGFRRRNSTASIAYLKGAQEMFRDGLLATVDVSKLADAHVGVYEAMARTACGRYICFDRVIRRVEDVAELERHLGIPNRTSIASSSDQPPTWFELSKRKLSRLMSSSRRCSYDIYSIL